MVFRHAAIDFAILPLPRDAYAACCLRHIDTLFQFIFIIFTRYAAAIRYAVTLFFRRHALRLRTVTLILML